MRRIEHADQQRAAQPAPQAEPEGGQDDRQVVEPLKDIVQIEIFQRGQVVGKADQGDAAGQYDKPERLLDRKSVV